MSKNPDVEKVLSTLAEAGIKITKEIERTDEHGGDGVLVPEKELLGKWVGGRDNARFVAFGNDANIFTILTKDPLFVGRLRFESFTQTAEILVDSVWLPLGDEHAPSITNTIQTRYSFEPSIANIASTTIQRQIMVVVRLNEVNERSEWVKSIQWDKTPRLSSWLSSVYGVEEDEYHITVGKNWIMGMVKRMVCPGAKFDNVLVLQGPQNWGKSTSLAALAGKKFYDETTETPEGKDFFMKMVGKCIFEFSEGETLNRTETKKLKGVITTAEDKYRPPYERFTRTVPRTCAFAMTTNADHYLKDETGNRRWWPVTISSKADIEWIRNNREQLFAEALACLDAGETYWEYDETLFKAAQDERMIEDPAIDWVTEVVVSKKDTLEAEGISIAYILDELEKRKQKVYAEKIGFILKNKLDMEVRMPRINGKQKRRYYPTEATTVLNPTF